MPYAEGEVFEHRLVGEERVMLEKEAHLARSRRRLNGARGIEQDTISQDDAPAIGALESCNTAKQHRLSRAGRPKYGERRARLRLKGHIQRKAGKPLRDLDFQGHVSHAPTVPGRAHLSSNRGR